MTITEFLLDCTDRDEWVRTRVLQLAGFASVETGGEMGFVDPDAQRLLDDCKAQRRIIERAEEAQRAADAWTSERLSTDTRSPLPEWARRDAYAEVLRDLAATYSDHPDYDETWRA